MHWPLKGQFTQITKSGIWFLTLKAPIERLLASDACILAHCITSNKKTETQQTEYNFFYYLFILVVLLLGYYIQLGADIKVAFFVLKRQQQALLMERGRAVFIVVLMSY